MQALKNAVRDGWSKEKSALPRSVQPYWTFGEEISYADGLLFTTKKLIVPMQLRQEMLSKIHESHLGTVNCKARGRDIMHWPNMLTQITETMSRCVVCNENKNNNPGDPMLPHALTGRPWEKTGTDIFIMVGLYFCGVWITFLSIQKLES